MLRTIVQRWVQDGHEVDVLTSQPSYKSAVDNSVQPARTELDGACVVRLNLPPESGKPLVRIRNAFKLGMRVLWQAVFRKRYDVIMVSTSPPVLAGWFVAIAARVSGARFVYHCMDIHPEIGRISGEFRNPKIYSFLSRMDRWTCSQAKPVVVLSHDMASSLENRCPGKPPETLVINNFSLPSDVVEYGETLPFEWPVEPFVLIFAGNIGRFQGLQVLVEAMACIADRDDIHLLMMGEGAEKENLTIQAQKTGARITFVGHHSVATAKVAMKKASAGFVSLMPELHKYAYPSKTMTYLEQGCPVLVSVEEDSCLANDIVKNRVGLAVANGDAQKLADAIKALADDSVELEAMHKNATALASREFSEEAVMVKWSSLL
ncbi:glycosyltransferase family 4 protein [Neptuniibacter halophilus]|uniref:glycosyltransferase family 4 protein n=1 Tax=Neptuniibacter halophilus TaxID=651666 RepID=UPI002572C542|nr:glycosyltransferase family 4 protein [Neptuniibacter halophilus]